MDSGHDFLTPELLNVIFFQQKSIVLFPYGDQKHMKSLETFAVGHSVIDLDCTTLNDIKSIVEHETGTYSQNPNLYFIFNASKDLIASIQDMEMVHCIINTHEDVSSLASSRELLFYNKKNRKFLNWDFEPEELSFERYLFDNANWDPSILQDLLVRIKSIATRVYKALVETNNEPSIPIIFNNNSDTFPSNWWGRILEFMENFYDIKTPPAISKSLARCEAYGNGGIKVKSHKEIKSFEDFTPEYELIINTDRLVSNAFIRALHDYRSAHVNSANLELTQLYNPRELYNYLRNHHWKDGIDEKFVQQWLKNPEIMNEENSRNVKITLKKLNIPYKLVFNNNDLKELTQEDDMNLREVKERDPVNQENKTFINSSPEMPSIQNFEKFKNWIMDLLDKLET